MPKVLGAASLVVGLLAWSTVAPAALPQGNGSAPAGAAGLQLAHGGGGGGAHALYVAHAREKAAEKNELKKERDAVNEAKSGVSGEQGDDADAADKDDAESGMRAAHHAH